MKTYRLFWGWSANYAGGVLTRVAASPKQAIDVAYGHWIDNEDSRFRDEADFVVFEVGGDLVHFGKYADAPGAPDTDSHPQETQS